jgi:hypothetical protein
MSDYSALAAEFRHFAEFEVREQSPLYEAICYAIADDEQLLALAAQAARGQPPPNLILGVLHYLLDEFRGHPLARYYASLGGSAKPDRDLADSLRDFASRHHPEISALMRTRLVQTNEVRRSAAVLVAAAAAARAVDGAPLALIEIGPSAGLNLNFDRYHYDYGNGLVSGPPQSGCRIDCDARGTLAAGDIAMPAVASQIGLDIHPLDVGDERDMRWLRALLWPEEADRRVIFDAAVKIARREPPLLLSTDLAVALPTIIAMVPEPGVPFVVASFVLHQFTAALLDRFRLVLQEAGRKRPVYMALFGFAEFVTGSRRAGPSQLWLLRFDASGTHARLLAHANPHVRWLEFERESPWQPLG